MIKIIDRVRKNADFQRAIRIAPEEDRDRVIRMNEMLADQMDEMIGRLRRLIDDPELRSLFLEHLKREIHKRKGTSHAL